MLSKRFLMASLLIVHALAIKQGGIAEPKSTKLCTVEEGGGYCDLVSSPNYPNTQSDANLTCHFSIDNPQLKTIYIDILDLGAVNSSCEGNGGLAFYNVRFDSYGNEVGESMFHYASKVGGLLKFSFRKIRIEYLNYKSSCRGFQFAYLLRSSSEHRPSTVKPSQLFTTTESDPKELTTKLCTHEGIPNVNFLSSPDYPNSQSNANLTCHFPIDNPQLKTINIQILDLDFGMFTCRKSSSALLIYNVESDSNGNDIQETLIYHSTGDGVGEILQYSFGKVRIEFLNYQSSCRGFTLVYWFK